MLVFRKLWWVLVMAILMLVGCGGGGGGGAKNPVTAKTAVKFSVDWEARSRAISGPAAAQSVRVTVRNGLGANQDLVETFSRPTDPSAATASYVSTARVTPGPYNFEFAFYSEGSGAGSLVGTGAGSGVVGGDGNGVPTVAVTGTITRLAIDPIQTVRVGETQNLTFGAYNTAGQIVAITPGSVTFDITNGAEMLTRINDQVRGVSPGVATVIGRLGGLSSSPVNVYVVVPGTGGSIYGVVSNELGGPIAGVTVQTSDGVSTYITRSGSDGQYRLESIAAGNRVVTFSLGGFSTDFLVAVARGESTERNVTLRTFAGAQAMPVIQLDAPQVNQSEGLALVTGKIDNIESGRAIIILNSDETLINIDTEGRFSTEVILKPGANTIRIVATNSAGTAASTDQVVQYVAQYPFRVTLTWDGAGDIDLHTFTPDGEHSSYHGKTVSNGSLDVDNTDSFGPENFTPGRTDSQALTPGRYRVAVNSYSRGEGRNAIIQVTVNRGNGVFSTQNFGPYTFTASDGERGDPVNGPSWWCPVDVIVGSDGSVTVEESDGSPVTRTRARSAKPAKK